MSRARGLPDGATEDSDSDGSFFHQSEPNTPEKEAKSGKKGGKDGKEERKKTKNVG